MVSASAILQCAGHTDCAAPHRKPTHMNLALYFLFLAAIEVAEGRPIKERDTAFIGYSERIQTRVFAMATRVIERICWCCGIGIHSGCCCGHCD